MESFRDTRRTNIGGHVVRIEPGPPWLFPAVMDEAGEIGVGPRDVVLTNIGGYAIRVVPSERWVQDRQLHEIYVRRARERLERWRAEAAAARRMGGG